MHLLNYYAKGNRKHHFGFRLYYIVQHENDSINLIVWWIFKCYYRLMDMRIYVRYVGRIWSYAFAWIWLKGGKCFNGVIMHQVSDFIKSILGYRSNRHIKQNQVTSFNGHAILVARGWVVLFSLCLYTEFRLNQIYLMDFTSGVKLLKDVIKWRKILLKYYQVRHAYFCRHLIHCLICLYHNKGRIVHNSIRTSLLSTHIRYRNIDYYI